MLPKLKGDTLFIPTPDGVYFRNNQDSFKIKGKVIYQWVESLAPYLNGEHSLAQITTGLSSEKQAMVTELVNTLLAQGFLKDLSQDFPHHLSPTEHETYAAEIAFIDSFSDSAAARFEHFREHQALLIGSGLTLTGLVTTLLKGGLREVTVITTSECETNIRRHAASNWEPVRARTGASPVPTGEEQSSGAQTGTSPVPMGRGDPHQTLWKIDAPMWENEAEVLATLRAFDTIIHVSDQPMLARASMLNRLCVTYKKNLLQAIIVDDRAWIGPLVRPDPMGCWECAMLRLQGNLTNMQEQFPAYAFQDHVTAPISRTGASPVPTVAQPTATFIANLLGFEVFKSVTGAGPVETEGHLIEVNLETLQTQKHHFISHPLCRTCQHHKPRTQAEFLDIIRQLEQEEVQTSDQPSEDEDLFSKLITPCFEARLGLFSSLDEEGLVQLPFSVCKAVVSNPMPQEQATNPPTVLGSGFSFGMARKRAAQRACEIYAASLVDRRLFPSSQEDRDRTDANQTGTSPVPTISGRDWTGASPVPTIPPRTISGERFFSVAPLDEVEDWTWATDLSTGDACLVPAALVYPVLRGLSPLGDAGVGISSARSWAEAVGLALLKICRYLTITQLEHKQYPQVDLSILSPEGTRLRRLLEQMGERVTVYDVTGPLQVPTCAICSGDKTMAYGTHVDMVLALQNGLEQALLSKQVSGKEVLVNSLPFVPDLPLALRGGTTVGTRTGTSPVPTGDEKWPEFRLWLQDVLQANGWRAFAVPLDDDPALRQIYPCIVHVVIAHD